MLPGGQDVLRLDVTLVNSNRRVAQDHRLINLYVVGSINLERSHKRLLQPSANFHD